LLVVGAADAAGLDAEEGIVVADLRQRQFAHLKRTRGRLDDRARASCHDGWDVAPLTLRVPQDERERAWFACSGFCDGRSHAAPAPVSFAKLPSDRQTTASRSE